MAFPTHNRQHFVSMGDLKIYTPVHTFTHTHTQGGERERARESG